jgi:hypothetical protein
MRNSRFRQIARAEKLARPFLKRKQEADRESELTINGAVNHAAVLAFLIRYGEPQIDEHCRAHVSSALSQLHGRTAATNLSRS